MDTKTANKIMTLWAQTQTALKQFRADAETCKLLQAHVEWGSAIS